MTEKSIAHTALSPFSPHLGYLCPLEANVYDIEFTRFKLRDLDSGQTLFEVSKSPNEDDEPEKSDQSRFVRYHFPPPFLDLKTLGAT